MKIELRELSVQDNEEIFEMIQEIGPGENGFVNGLFDNSFNHFQIKLRKNDEMSKGINLEPHLVPQTIYWLYINDRPVGYGKLRHKLNEKLLESGGHIGYIIRPSERNKGYGTILLKELLIKARKLEIDKVLLTCDEENFYSRKVIEANNGVLTEVSKGKCKYWIQLV